MKKEIKYPIYGLAIGASAGIIIYLIEQYIKLKQQGLPYWQNLSKQQLLKYGGIGGGIGLIGGYGYYKLNFHHESKKPFNSNGYIRDVLSLNNGNGNSAFIQAKNIRNEIRDFLSNKYASRLAGKIENWGSTARGTATNNCDFDMLIPYHRNSFFSLEEMYEDLFSTLKENYPNCDIRRQGHSIGLTCSIEVQEVHFDIVPGREIHNYQSDKEINLFVKGGMFKNPSRIKTNVRAPKELTVNRPKERAIVKLMKVYRDRYGFNVKSTFLQHLVFEAFDVEPPTSSTSTNLIYAMEYLAEKLPYARIIDPGNSNNVISARINDSARVQMADQLSRDLGMLDKNKHYLKQIFPV